MYPLFLPTVAWGWIIAIWIGLFSDPMPPGITGPSGSNGFLALGLAFVALIIGTGLQLVIGWPSLRLLRRWKSLPVHLTAGVLLGLGLAILGSIFLRAPKLGESAFTALPGTAMFFLPPFVAGYLRLYYLHRAESA
ncbi:hypothetical protein ACXR0O_11260 [Verrucomicrobiota bacterium sgz303538]